MSVTCRSGLRGSPHSTLELHHSKRQPLSPTWPTLDALSDGSLIPFFIAHVPLYVVFVLTLQSLHFMIYTTLLSPIVRAWKGEIVLLL